MLVLDFDGTVTDAEIEGKPFRDGYLEDIAILAGAPRAKIDELAAQHEAEVAANPDAHGWVYGGAIVAPATVDPYLRIMPVARAIFDACGVFPDEDDRNRLLDGILYKYNYQKTEIAFRPGARELLHSLIGLDAYVVTNSHTEPVRDKIHTLANGTGELDWWLPRVHGRAKKYIIDPSFDAVPESMTLEGLSRPVLLRRRHYHDVLAELLAGAGMSWGDLLVVGDIFELDLALPVAMGARVGLMVNAFTPDYEKQFVASHARGVLLTGLDQVTGLAKG